jgi:hypothetical protein
MIILRSESLLLRIDPRHGGEILDLVDLTSGRQLLGKPPFGSNEPVAGDLDETTWTQSYRGGWQLLTPNAGHACTVNGIRHGFHGRASNDPWIVSSVDDGTATLFWTGHNLQVVRKIVVHGEIVEVFVRITSLGESVPLVAVEHIAFGIELLDPMVEIDLPIASAFEIDESRKALSPLSTSTRWPDVQLASGTIERSDCWPLQINRGRLICLANLEAGWAGIRNVHRGFGIVLAWETDWLQHLWIWHEIRKTEGLWRGQTEMLILEPTTTPHCYGLEHSLAEGFATKLTLGESRHYRMVVRPFHGSLPIKRVDIAGDIEHG